LFRPTVQLLVETVRVLFERYQTDCNTQPRNLV
jgi:hypothetical protein